MKPQALLKKPVILDTDMSPDSWAAVLYLALHPQVDLLAVSISGTGESHGEIGARNAARLLALAGKENVRIGFGQPKPLKGSNHFPGLMRFVMDRMLFIPIPSLKINLKYENSVKMISSILNEHPRAVSIAAVGPQTNLANVLLRHPGLKDKIESVTIMGGAVDVPGNIHDIGFWIKNDVAEWNFFCDPLAVKTVFESGVKIQLVPLDATNQVPVTQEFVVSFQKQAHSTASDFVLQMIKRIVGNFRRNVAYHLWDPMTCATAVNPDLCQFEEMRLDIVTESGNHWAGVVKSDDGVKIKVARKIQKEQFENGFIDVICGM